MAFWNPFTRTSEAIEVAPAPVYTVGDLVVCEARAAAYGGVVVDTRAGEALVRYYRRDMGDWSLNWWPLAQVRPLNHGLSADKARRVARRLLSKGAL